MWSPEAWHVWIVLVAVIAVGLAPMILFHFFGRRDLADLLITGVEGQATLLGYKNRPGPDNSTVLIAIYELRPPVTPRTVSYGKIISSRKKKPVPGSVVAIRYRASAPTWLAIDAFGYAQEAESFPDSLELGEWETLA